MNNTMGTFGAPSFLSIGDEYGKKTPVDDRYKGKQFNTSPTKKGTMPSVFFEKAFHPLYEGEKYENPGASERKDVAEQRKKMLNSSGFRPSSPSKKGSGLGSYFGCIGPAYPHEKEYDVQGKGEKRSPSPPAPKNLYTSPGKRGTFGVPGTMIGKPADYQADPFDSALKLEREERKKAADANVTKTPFKSTTHGVDFFDSYANVAASKVFTPDRPLPPVEKEDKPEKKIVTPFRPSSPPKSGLNGTFSAFPEYKEDPIDLKQKAEREERAKAKPTIVFKPISNPKSSPTKSILFHQSH